MTVVKDLLYLDKLELEMNPEEFKAADMIRTCLDITRELATEAGVNIVINTYPQLIYGDRNRLIQVLVNLLTNSIKFSPRGGTIRIETATTRGCFELRVSDQGRGIPESVRKQIFEPFKQVNADDAKRGAGLGLTIARTIIHQHGGEIAVESSEGKGSTFFFRIPLSCQNAIYHRRPAQPRFPGLIANEKYLPMFKGNFSVLQQSFTILALPLIFQSVFVSIVGCLLYKIPGQMMTTMEAILATGLVFNVAMSVYLALFLTRRFTKRLQHIMENTRRLVRREELLMPLGGHDEISFLDETLYETARHLVELESFKRDLVLVVRNELKTPLMAILVSLEMFEKGSLGQISMKARGRLAIAKGEANRLIRLTSDLLNIETIQAGKIVLNKSAVNISEIVNWSIQSVATLAERKSINISAKVPNVVSVVDSDRICQVLINLLSNAIKYSPDGSDIQVEVSWHDDQVEFRIVDHGRGIPADLNVFEPYVQVSEEDSTVLSGTGLGLTIARSIIEEHGGHIGVNSQPGVGSTFWFQLPTCA
jgi:signal transduction histidine kinase